MGTHSIKKNFLYSLIFQLTGLLMPLVVTPYVSRVLAVEGIGLYSYTESIVSYFVLVAVLGTSTFGQRAISYTQDDPEGRSRAFFEVLLLRLMTAAVTAAAYVGYVFVAVDAANRTIALVFLLNILNVVLDISWLLQGLEEFGKMALRSVLLRLAGVACIFIFVRDEGDLILYTIIMLGAVVLGNLSLWLYVPKYVCRVRGIRPFRNIGEVLQLFVPTIAIQLYTVLDKSMIGWFSKDGYRENGYYEQAQKLVKLAVTGVTALGTVMIPRIAYTYRLGDTDRLHYYVYRSYRYVFMMGVPMMFGFLAVADELTPIYYGPGYEKCGVLISIFSAIVLFIGVSNVTGYQYLVPIGRQNVLTMTVFIGSAVNIVMNLILIPAFSSVGASIATVVAEFVVALAGFIYLKRKHEFPLAPIFRGSVKYWIAGGGMFAALMVVKRFLPVTLPALIGLIAGAAALYFLLLLLLRDGFVREILGRVLSRLSRKAAPVAGAAENDTTNENAAAGNAAVGENTVSEDNKAAGEDVAEDPDAGEPPQGEQS